MDVPVIKTPKADGEAIDSLSDFLSFSGGWHRGYAKSQGGMLSDLWYRGVNTHFDYQAPGVYRDGFTRRAKVLNATGGIEDKRLRLERDVISQFRSAGAAFLEEYSRTQIYFSAQHSGMPTRLLDWSTNPLAALFFACDGNDDHDGFVYAMDAKQVIPKSAQKMSGRPLVQSVMTMRHRFVEYAIGVSFWDPLKEEEFRPYVLPVRPDVIPGRIGQQSSCFTFHMHRAAPVENPTLVTMRITAARKRAIRDELHRVNINQFTTYYDLDHLSREIKSGWGY